MKMKERTSTLDMGFDSTSNLELLDGESVFFLPDG
jgi:hypothetical protein